MVQGEMMSLHEDKTAEKDQMMILTEVPEGILIDVKIKLLF